MQLNKIKPLYTSCEIEGEQPYKFYIEYGFIDTGLFDDNEKVIKIYI